ncbi:MAG: hypothetical protein AAGE01_21165, partial [Pseudomonadota bacterium]
NKDPKLKTTRWRFHINKSSKPFAHKFHLAPARDVFLHEKPERGGTQSLIRQWPRACPVNHSRDHFTHKKRLDLCAGTVSCKSNYHGPL